MDKIERKIFFYKIKIKNNGNTVNIKPVFDQLNKMPFNENGRYLKVDDGNYISIYIDKNNYPIYCRLGHIRKKGLPSLEKKGNIEPLSIEKDAGLYEPSHFVIFPNNVVGFEYNFYGPRPPRLKWYLLKKANGLFDNVELILLTRKDINDVLNKIGTIKLFTLKAHRNMSEIFKKIDRDLYTMFETAKNSTDAKEIGILLSSGRTRKGITINFLKKLLNFIKTGSSETEGISKLQIRAENIKSGKIEPFDILEDVLISTKKVAKHDEIHRIVDRNSMYRAIVEAYNEIKEEIDKILGEENVSL